MVKTNEITDQSETLEKTLRIAIDLSDVIRVHDDVDDEGELDGTRIQMLDESVWVEESFDEVLEIWSEYLKIWGSNTHKN